MPMNDPHAYMTRSDADMQMQNPKNPKFKGKSGSKKPVQLKDKFKNLAKGRKSKKSESY